MDADYDELWQLYFNSSTDPQEANRLLKQIISQMSQNETDQRFTTDILKEHQSLKIFIIVIYSIVIFFGFIENLLVFIVIAKHKHLHKVTNIFIASLTISDIMLCVFNLPFQLHYQLTENWMFGEVLCRIIMPTFGLPIFYSTACMMMIAVDRFILIVFPFKKRISKTTALCLVILIVFVTICLSTPVMVHAEYKNDDDELISMGRVICMEKWITTINGMVYSVSIFTIQMILPFTLTTILYFKIYAVLKGRPLKRSETRRNYRTNKILIAIVVLFAVSWLPWNIYSLIISFNPKVVRGAYFTLIDLLLKIIAMSSTCINPFLYGWLNGNFRKELGFMLGKKLSFTRNGYTNTYAESSKCDAPQSVNNDNKFTTAV